MIVCMLAVFLAMIEVNEAACQKVDCLRAPCTEPRSLALEECLDQYPHIQCVDNYCDGCYKNFYYNGVEVCNPPTPPGPPCKKYTSASGAVVFVNWVTFYVGSVPDTKLVCDPVTPKLTLMTSLCIGGPTVFPFGVKVGGLIGQTLLLLDVPIFNSMGWNFQIQVFSDNFCSVPVGIELMRCQNNVWIYPYTCPSGGITICGNAACQFGTRYFVHRTSFIEMECWNPPHQPPTPQTQIGGAFTSLSGGNEEL